MSPRLANAIRSAAPARSQIGVRSWVVAFVFSSMFLLAGCASQPRLSYEDEAGPDAGTIEFVNESPQYLFSVSMFEDSEDCRASKSVATLEHFEMKRIRAKHRSTLTVAMTYTHKTSTKFGTCSGLYSVPFADGNLKVLAVAANGISPCHFAFAMSFDGVTWAPVKGARKRTGLSSLSNTGAMCAKTDG